MKEWSFPICPCHKNRTVLENSLSLQTTCLIRSINFCCAPANYKRVENGNLTKGGSQKNQIIWNLILSPISPKKDHLVIPWKVSCGTLGGTVIWKNVNSPNKGKKRKKEMTWERQKREERKEENWTKKTENLAIFHNKSYSPCSRSLTFKIRWS